jgi:hypothetical protein
MFVNMLSFERSKSFQYKYNCLESLEDYKSPEDYRSLEDHKKHREPQNHEESRKPRNPGSPQESRKSARVKEDCQVSRIQNPKSLEDWQNARVKIQENNS